jgi:prevent-host-death family protein
MFITATEFKNNIGKYLSLVNQEDIFITKNGKSVAKLSGARQNKVDIVKSLIGSVPNGGITLQETKEERLSRYENTD